MHTVLEWIDHAADDRGIHFSDSVTGWSFVSHSTLAGEAHRVAALLHAHGAQPGDVVSLLVNEVRDFAPAFLGTMLAGLTPAPIASPLTFQGNDRYTEHVTDVLKVAEPALVLSDASLAEIAEKTSAQLGGGSVILLEESAGLSVGDSARRTPAELGLLQFTSGSSGSPKGVRVSRDNLAANVRSIHEWLGTTASDSCSSWLPLYHDMGLIGTFLGSLTARIDLWLMSPLDFVRNPLRWLEAHGRHGATMTTAPNFGYGYTAKRVRPQDLEGMDFSHWRVAMNGAERIDPRAAAAFAALLAPHGFRTTAFAPCYGLAEATLAVSGVTPGSGARTVRLEGGLHPGRPVVPTGRGELGTVHPDGGASWLTSCGPAVPGAAVDIVDEDGAVLPEGHFGEIRVRGTSVAGGYRSRVPDASSNFTDDGLRTGDAGFLLEGELFVVGRVGDSIKVRGRKVHAEDLETGLTAVDGIPSGRCAVALGTTGEAHHVVAVVEAGDSGWLDGALAVIRAATDDTVRVTVVRAARGGIPRTSSGKPRRRLLWRRFQDGAALGEVVHGTAPAAPVTG
ncbi:AMP-binding protein [Actinacidiphila glaucinigra]|uniref:AMP-binding protein n=1 Tax=Actinacidiphila glaucinigra TaxID=235986 RepID=UPI0035E15DF0